MGLLVVSAVVVAMPCVTHRVIIGNKTAEPAQVQITARGEPLWEGGVDAFATRDLPLITNSGWDPLEIHVSFPGSGLRDVAGRTDYALGHPHNTDIFVVILTEDRVDAVQFKYPFIDAVASELWRDIASLLAVFYNGLSCLDYRIAKRL
ncbi:MAG: hypothetical protein MJE12_03320 [Alphaproteobacteria bacterium]|nr:hypothetical protein [Alphaproteobacteria bacterium]